MELSQLVKLIVFLSLNLPWIQCDTQREMTLIVGPKTVECLYEKIGSNENIDFEYQVIDGGQGDLDINFELSLGERQFYSDVKSSDNFHRIEREDHQGGDFKFCFDNTGSSFNSKTVFFELVSEDPDRQPSEGEQNLLNEQDGLSPHEFYQMKIEDIDEIVQTVRKHLTKARQIQDMLRSFEARDRNMAELNNSRVGLLSMLIIVTMIGVAFLQAFLIKSLFEVGNKKTVWSESMKLFNKFYNSF